MLTVQTQELIVVMKVYAYMTLVLKNKQDVVNVAKAIILVKIVFIVRKKQFLSHQLTHVQHQHRIPMAEFHQDQQE